MFIPDNFAAPEMFITESYRLEILSPKFAELDYDAVMSSKARFRKVFGNTIEWPKDNMTLEENIRDIKRHEQEFKLRKAFAYTVLNLSMKKCIGCVYIDPPLDIKYDSEVYLWVRDSYFEFDLKLYSDVKNWLINVWPFKKTAFPGREIPWSK